MPPCPRWRGGRGWCFLPGWWTRRCVETPNRASQAPTRDPKPQPLTATLQTTQVNEFDQKKAASALGVDSRPLTRANVEKFLADFGLEAEFSCHSNIRGLSGGWACGVCVCACVFVCVRACARVRARACVCARACVRECVACMGR